MSFEVLAAVDGLLLRGCVVACETDRSAQAKCVEYLTRFVHTLPLADTPLAAPRARWVILRKAFHMKSFERTDTTPIRAVAAAAAGCARAVRDQI